MWDGSHWEVVYSPQKISYDGCEAGPHSEDVPKPDNPISSSDTCLKAFGDCLVATNAGDTFVRVGVTDATSDGVINEDDDVEY